MDNNDGSPNATTRSRIPRPPSKLPVPGTRLGVRPSASRDSLRAVNPITVPRIRSTPSGAQPSSVRNKDVSTETVIHTPLRALSRPEFKNGSSIRKPSNQVPARQQEPSPRPAQKTTPGRLYQAAPAEDANDNGAKSGTPRQSLSERTMETLSQLPSSPAVRRRASSFFNPESPMRPPSRASNTSGPGSRPTSRDHPDTLMMPPPKSVTSRPSSSSGYTGKAIPIDFRASTNTFRPPKSSLITETPPRTMTAPKTLKAPLRSSKSNANLRSTSTPSKLQSSGLTSTFNGNPPTTIKNTTSATSMASGSKTLSARPLKPRASISGLFRKPSMPELNQGGTGARIVPNKISPTFSNTSSDGKSSTSKASARTSSSVESAGEQAATLPKTSISLREQIAKAKAAKRAQAEKQLSATRTADFVEESPIIPVGTFDFGLSDDPFGQQVNMDVGKGLLRKRIDAARMDGRLNIAAMALKEIPAEVMNMYNFDAINDQGGNWAESVDLTRFIAADNELEVLGDDIFPDTDPLEMSDDNDSQGNQFGGLETMDLHGNVLKTLPLGLKRLGLLTTLNLSNNKLDNASFDVVSQIKGLRDLKIGSNNLSGELSPSITNLRNLEVLDVRNNSLTSLPEGLAELIHLRILNLSQNGFTALPFEALRRLPLVELSAAKNKLSGVLIALHDVEMPQLKVLDVSVNSLTSLTSDEVRFPALHQLSCFSNRITSLPNMTSWKSLLTIAAEDNHISSIPAGFVTLLRIKNVDFSGNDIKVLDDEIGRMESLDVFRISGNPLREKKFSGMSVDDLKRALSARLAPPEPAHSQEDSFDEFTSCPTSPISSNTSLWPVKAGGILDRSNTQSHSLDPVVAAQFAENNTVRVLQLHHNFFREIPTSLELFAATLTTLNISHNELSSDTFLQTDLELPALQELNLSSNTLTTLLPLLQQLHAPQLEKLDVSFNRLSSLPTLRTSFPSITVVLASNNSIAELHPEAVKGLKILDCSSNDIGSLNARIGLLGGPGGLERLDVSGNRFRVPKYTILEKGTEATLAWLRDRIPADETNVDDVD